jgi:hypothetical protein
MNRASARRAPCERLWPEHRRVCFSSSADDRNSVQLTVGPNRFSCRLPFNMPGVHDSQRPKPSPLLPPATLPRPVACSGREAPSQAESRLVVLRTRWPHNFMEFFTRVLVAAPTLLTARSAAISMLVPNLPAGLPAFYNDILGPLSIELHSSAAALRGRSFHAPTFCCVNSITDLNRTAVDTLVDIIRRHHLATTPRMGQFKQPPQPTYAAMLRRSVAIIERDPPQPAGDHHHRDGHKGSLAVLPRRAHSGRAITTLETLLEECERRAAECHRLRFPPAVPFSQSLRVLERASILVGFHGAGLANALFMRRPGATVVEVLPKGFAQPGSFAMTPDKYGWLAEVGVRRVRVIARETSSAACTTPSERARREWERLRDCDVDLSWDEVDAAIRPEPAKSVAWRTQQRASWQCTAWPANATASVRAAGDEARCLSGNRLRDGFVYAHNRGRSSPLARCGGGCACCRRPGAEVVLQSKG